MTARVTQQVLFVGYNTNPLVRVTAVAIEVIRANSSSPIVAHGIQVVVVAS